MVDVLVGYTGFVGSNLLIKHRFTHVYNSKNIQSAFGTKPDLLVYAGVPSAMYLANKEPESDLDIIKQAENNIRCIQAKCVVLISTVAVYDRTVDVNEDFVIDSTKLTPYGKHRYILEQFVIENCSSHLIVRLPALYGENLKKNFIFDFIHIIPKMLTKTDYINISKKMPQIAEYYAERKSGYYEHKTLEKQDKIILKNYFQKLNFSALNFTDSRSQYQFYNLSNLWGDINCALQHGIKLINLVPEPILVSELYASLTSQLFENKIMDFPYQYNIKTKYDYLFNHFDGYIRDKKNEIVDINQFIQKEVNKLSND